MASDASQNDHIVIRAPNADAFAQNGQIDWISFLRSTAEATISILTRLSRSGVEPLTVLVAQQALSTLALTRDAERNVIAALSFLRPFGAFGNVLWFGFGVKHMVRSLGQTREGLGCLCICAALAETFSPEISASILSAFLDLTGIPRDISPSIAQWKQLVIACSGCLRYSDFGSVVLEFCSLSRSPKGAEEASDPQAIAEAMIGLAKVSSGFLDSIVFTGGPACGWLGAVAEWVLGLSVAVETETGEITHRGSFAKVGERAQVRILYKDHESSGSTALLIAQRSYRLDEASQVVREQYDRSLLILCIRVPWTSALRKTFGKKPISRLIEDMQTAFTTAIGSAACIFNHIANANAEVERDDLWANKYYLDGTYGTGLLATIGSCFPEISEEQISGATEHLGARYKDACMAYEGAIVRISAACTCSDHRCERGIMPHTDDTAGTTENTSYGSTCLSAFLEMIIRVSRGMACIIVDSNLYPAQSGLYKIYEVYRGRQDQKPLVRLFTDSDTSLLTFVITLFCGSCPSTLYGELDHKISAITHRGLCFYLDALCTLSSPEGLLRVHIVPGSVQLDSRTYTMVLDPIFEPPKYAAKSACMVTELPDSLPLPLDDLEVNAVVTETESYITCAYKITSPRGSAWIPPALLTQAAVKTIGNVSCSSERCPRLKNLPPLQIVLGEGIVKSPNPKLSTRLRVVPRSGPGWCVALMHSREGDVRMPLTSLGQSRQSAFKIKYDVILRRSECFNCCLKNAMQMDRCEIIVRE